MGIQIIVIVLMKSRNCADKIIFSQNLCSVSELEGGAVSHLASITGDKPEHHDLPLFAIKTTPVIIITAAIIICGVIASPSIAHPKITATTGLT
jgi:energy-converting hydrogenase Eha subunit A